MPARPHTWPHVRLNDRTSVCTLKARLGAHMAARPSAWLFAHMHGYILHANAGRVQAVPGWMLHLMTPERFAASLKGRQRLFKRAAVAMKDGSCRLEIHEAVAGWQRLPTSPRFSIHISIATCPCLAKVHVAIAGNQWISFQHTCPSSTLPYPGPLKFKRPWPYEAPALVW